MPCFSCTCFSDGKGRNGECLKGGRGYCQLHDQEYWRGHECRDYAPTWYAPKRNEPKSSGFSGFFKKRKKEEESFSDLRDQIGYYLADALFNDDEETEYSEVEIDSKPGKRLKTVRKHIEVDDSVFRKYGLSFKCHLTEDYDTLQLNFEIEGKKADLSEFPKYNELTIKANAYDKKGNLLCIEETGFDYGELKRGYIADYFYFSHDSMVDAYSLRVYAEDPADDDF